MYTLYIYWCLNKLSNPKNIYIYAFNIYIYSLVSITVGYSGYNFND